MLNNEHAKLLRRIRTGMTHGGDAQRLETALRDEYQAGYLAGSATRPTWGGVFLVNLLTFGAGVLFAAVVVFPGWV